MAERAADVLVVRKLVVTRHVRIDDPYNFSGRDVAEGEVLYRFMKATYGCIDYEGGIPATWDENGDYPFFEFPRDAVRDA